MSAFRSPYDREFELQEQEEHKAYQRGFNVGRKSVLDKIRAEIQEELKQDNHSFYRAALEDVIKIIDRYEGEQK